MPSRYRDPVYWTGQYDCVPSVRPSAAKPWHAWESDAQRIVNAAVSDAIERLTQRMKASNR